MKILILDQTKKLALISSVAVLAGCADSQIPWETDLETQRWYSKAQVIEGKEVFRSNCARCHGRKAQGANNWVTPDAKGLYPPPPLNGTAHAWHHPYPMLVDTIKSVTKGNMPSWEGILTDEEITSSIAYFQDFWPDQAYTLWLKRHKR